MDFGQRIQINNRAVVAEWVSMSSGALSGAVETAPFPADYALPDTEDGINELIEKMTMLGMSYAEAEANVKKRKKLYLQALKRFELKGNASKKERPTKYRRNSLNAN